MPRWEGAPSVLVYPALVRTRSFVLLGCLVGAAACSPKAPASSLAAPPPPHVFDKASVADVIARVTAIRHLDQRRAISVARMSSDAFFEAFLESTTPSTASEERREGFMVGFDFTADPASRGALPTRDQVLKAFYGGYYDPRADRIFLPRSDITSDDEWVATRSKLAHEVEHALQAQHFAAPDQPLAEPIAWTSLLEGDAKFVEIAYVASVNGQTLSRALRHQRDRTEGAPIEAFMPNDAADVLRAVLPIDGQHLAFPYRAGLRFVTDLYRAGGLDLVDQAFATPPTTTEQILHPEAFLRGEVPRTIARPAAPPGDELVARGVLGELDTRILLGRCHPYGDAEFGAAGWNGDRFAVFAAPDRSLDVAWISAWDTERDAEEFESLVSADACWKDNALAAGTGTIAAKHATLRSGAVVAFMRGERASEEGARALLELVGPAPERVVLSSATIPPLRPLLAPRKGQVDSPRYRSAWLGLHAEAPPRFEARPGSVNVETEIVAIRGHSSANVAVLPRIFDDAQNEIVLADHEEALREWATARGLAPRRIGGGLVEAPLGRGIDRWYRLDGSTWSAGVVLIPICGAAASLRFTIVVGDDADRGAIDAWIQSFRRTSDERPPACEYFDPT